MPSLLLARTPAILWRLVIHHGMPFVDQDCGGCFAQSSGMGCGSFVPAAVGVTGEPAGVTVVPAEKMLVRLKTGPTYNQRAEILDGHHAVPVGTDGAVLAKQGGLLLFKGNTLKAMHWTQAALTKGGLSWTFADTVCASLIRDGRSEFLTRGDTKNVKCWRQAALRARAAEKATSRRDAHSTVTACLVRMGRAEEGLAYLKRYVGTGGVGINSFWELDALLRTGRFDEALKTEQWQV